MVELGIIFCNPLCIHAQRAHTALSSSCVVIRKVFPSVISPLSGFHCPPILRLALQQLVGGAGGDDAFGVRVIFVVDVSLEEVHKSCWELKFIIVRHTTNTTEGIKHLQCVMNHVKHQLIICHSHDANLQAIGAPASLWGMLMQIFF